jgi:hypothetical protein
MLITITIYVKDLVNERVKEIIAVGSSKEKISNFFGPFKKFIRQILMKMQ